MRIALGFVLFGLSASACTAALPLLWVACLGRPSVFQHSVRQLVRLGFKGVLTYAQWIRVIDLEIIDHGEWLTQANKPAILVCNHISLLDVLIIIATFPECYTFVKEKFSKNPFIRFVISSAGFIPVIPSDPAQSGMAFQRALTLVREGKTLVIFPEGTRSKTGKLGAFHKGAFRLALEAGKDITPVLFTSESPVLNNFRSFPSAKGQVQFKVHILPKLALPTERLLPSKDVARLHRDVHAFFVQQVSSERAFEWNRMS